MSSAEVYVETIKSGDGNNFPREGDKVTVHYDAFFSVTNGHRSKYDSSKDRGTPLKFIVGAEQVIPG